MNKFKYRRANNNSTGSCMSITTASSSLSTAGLCFNKMFPVPRSPEAENRTPSFEQAIVPIFENNDDQKTKKNEDDVELTCITKHS